MRDIIMEIGRGGRKEGREGERGEIDSMSNGVSRY
jgi:hypothetical protein